MLTSAMLNVSLVHLLLLIILPKGVLVALSVYQIQGWLGSIPGLAAAAPARRNMQQSHQHSGRVCRLLLGYKPGKLSCCNGLHVRCWWARVTAAGAPSRGDCVSHRQVQNTWAAHLKPPLLPAEQHLAAQRPAAALSVPSSYCKQMGCSSCIKVESKHNCVQVVVLRNVACLLLHLCLLLSPPRAFHLLALTFTGSAPLAGQVGQVSCPVCQVVRAH